MKKNKIKIPMFDTRTEVAGGMSYNDVVSQQQYVQQYNDDIENQAKFFENVKPWRDYVTDVVLDIASMFPRPEVQIVADSYQRDADGVIRDVQQTVIPKISKSLITRGNYLQQQPTPPRRVLPALPGESAYSRQRRQARYNRSNPRLTPREEGFLYKGLGKLFTPYQVYLMYKDAQQLWKTVKNYPKKDKDGKYKYNR